ncbi:hypothetical protein D3C84_1096460 [compost metagenome]
MPLHQSQPFLLSSLSVDVGRGDLAQRVVEHHLGDMAVDADVCPGGASHFAQVMAGPLLLTQPGKHSAGLVIAKGQSTTGGKQIGTLITLGGLTIPVPTQQRTGLVG